MRLGVCALGDPLDPATWSGTPARICRELDTHGCLGPTVDSARYAGERPKEVARRCSRILYPGATETGRGLLERYLRSRHTRKRFRQQGTAHVLHFGTYALPLFSRPGKERHYLYCDSTWHLASEALGSLVGTSDRLTRHAETLERRAYADVAHIFSIGHYVKQDLVGHYGLDPDKVTVVGTGRGGIQPYHGEKDYGNGVVLFVAKCRFEEKGGPLVLEGFRHAHRTNPRLRLIIVGDPQYRAIIGDVPGVTVLPYVTLDDLQALFNRAMLFAMPARYEPWGLVYLEALSCRTPVLGLNRNALPEITCDGEFGCCLREETPEELARVLLHAYDHPDELAAMGAKGQEHCLKTFTWERTVQSMLDVIHGYAE